MIRQIRWGLILAIGLGLAFWVVVWFAARALF